MRGRKPVRPLAEVADAAVRVFTDKGFRPAGISDVAAALGLSHGALYTYVDSKQALLYLALLRTVRPDAVGSLTLPVTAPPPEEIVTLLESWVVSQASAAALPDTGRTEDELGALIDALYGFIERNRRALQLIAQCAADLPELANWYFVQTRRASLERIAEFLHKRIDAGELRPVPDVPAAARFINETIAWFAMHRHSDPDSAMLDDDACRRTVRHLLLAAFLPAADETALPARPPYRRAPSAGGGHRSATRTRRRSLPVSVFGSSGRNTIVSGVFDDRSRPLTHSRASSASPRPTTTSTSSISAGAMFSPPQMRVDAGGYLKWYDFHQ